MKPKVLFISNNCFSDHANNGKTFKSFFSNYNKNEIAQIFFTHTSKPDFSFCDKYFFISDKAVLFNILKIKKNTGLLLNEESFKLIIPNKNVRSNLVFINDSLKRILRDILWSFGSWKSKKLIEFVSDFKPEVIFFVGGPSKFAHDIALYLQGRFKLKLIVYFTDDYVLYPKVSNFWDCIQKRRVLKFYFKTLNYSYSQLTVGYKMSRVYSLFFKRKFSVIMNSVHLLPPPNDLSPNEKIRICYFGSLHTNRWIMIEKLGLFILKYFSDQIQLNVYTAELLSNEIINKLNSAGVFLNGPVFGDQLIYTMQNSDALLHVESDDFNSISKTKLSVSTKLPEYLNTGRIIVGYGPANVASMELIADNNIGIFINSNSNYEILEFQFKKLLSSSFRKTIGLRGYNYAISNFDSQKKCLDIQTILNIKL